MKLRLCENLKEYLKRIHPVVLLHDKAIEFYCESFSDEIFLKRRFLRKVGRPLELVSPTRFTDKVQWLKLHWRNSLASRCADKFEVREYVASRVGAQYLNDLHGVYDGVEDIDLGSLPNRFVLKVTHGSGFNIVCRDKSKLDWNLESRKLKRWLGIRYHVRYNAPMK